MLHLKLPYKMGGGIWAYPVYAIFTKSGKQNSYQMFKRKGMGWGGGGITSFLINILPDSCYLPDCCSLAKAVVLLVQIDLGPHPWWGFSC